MSQLELKNRGMSLAANANKQWLEKARKIALEVAQEKEEISIEDVRLRWIGEFPYGNWCGSVFKNGFWEPVLFTLPDGSKQQKTITTVHADGHCRRVSLWSFNPHAKNPVCGGGPVAVPNHPTKTATHGPELPLNDRYDQHGVSI